MKKEMGPMWNDSFCNFSCLKSTRANNGPTFFFFFLASLPYFNITIFRYEEMKSNHS